MDISIEITKDDGSLKTLEEIEKEVLIFGLETQENLVDLAKQLDIGRSTLYRKIEQYNLKGFIKKTRERSHCKIIDEKSTISKAMVDASNIDELCSSLNMDKSILKEKLKLHGLLFVPKIMSYTERLAAERKRHEAAGTLLVTC